MRWFSKRSVQVAFTLMLLIVFWISTSPAFSIGPLDSPNVEKGVWTLEYAGSRDNGNLQAHRTTLAYAPSDRWKTIIGGTFARDPDHNVTLENMEWENIFQFSESGKHWVDSGMSVAYVASMQSREPDAIEAKLLLEKEWGKFTHMANLGLEQEVGKDSSGGPEYSVLWSSRYAYSEHFQPGFEIQSNFSKAGEHLGFQEQEHYIGPGIYGSIFEHVGYEAVFFWGATNASSPSALRILLEYQRTF